MMNRLAVVMIVGWLIVITIQLTAIESAPPTDWREPPWIPAPTDASDVVQPSVEPVGASTTRSGS